MAAAVVLCTLSWSGAVRPWLRADTPWDALPLAPRQVGRGERERERERENNRQNTKLSCSPEAASLCRTLALLSPTGL